jgi:[acyl-carrier-protein] S-malonyltransferase
MTRDPLAKIGLVVPLHLGHVQETLDEVFAPASRGVPRGALVFEDVPAFQSSGAVHRQKPPADVTESSQGPADREEDGFAQRERLRAELQQDAAHEPPVMPLLVLDLPDAGALGLITHAFPVSAVRIAGRQLARIRVLQLGDESMQIIVGHGVILRRVMIRAVEHNTAFVFPGQGSQYAGMGKDVAARFPIARRVFDSIDAALGYSISHLAFEGPEDALKLTENTQPAILAVSSAIHAVLEDAGAARRDLVAGHSLGEYSAIVSVGGLTPAEAAKIVHLRGKFMQEAVPVGTGGMAALIGPSVEDARAICEEAAQGEIVSVANINAPGQIVIAGTKAGIDRAIDVAKKRGVRRALPLPVSAPFHCELMKPAEERLRPVLDGAEFKDLRMSLVSNVDASPIGTATAVRNALLRQVASPVRWVESVEKMVAMGVRRFVEVGPGSVLTGLIKRIDNPVELINVSDVPSIEAFIEKVRA